MLVDMKKRGGGGNDENVFKAWETFLERKLLGMIERTEY